MHSADDLREALIAQLQSLARSGLAEIPRGDAGRSRDWRSKLAVTTGSNVATESILNVPEVSGARDTSGSADVADHPEPNSALQYPVPLSAADRGEALRVLQAEVAQCTACTELVQSRTQTVFGVGNIQPRLCFFGEAPGADEDRQGEPFVGKAGQLLNKIIAACKLTREEVYILNAIKCRPRLNRTPSDEEVETCWRYAQRQLDILQPEFICCLGAVAVRSLLKTRGSISSMRGRFFDYRDSKVMVTYHPAYLLRETSAKRLVWEDMQMLMRAMGIQLNR